MGTVFISYSHIDCDIASKAKEILEKNGISCWMAPESIESREDYASSISHAISECKFFLLILSNNSQLSNQVRREIDFAVNNGKQIIPFHIDDSVVNREYNFLILGNVKTIEAYNRTPEALNELVEVFKLDQKNISVHDALPKIGINNQKNLRIDDEDRCPMCNGQLNQRTNEKGIGNIALGSIVGSMIAPSSSFSLISFTGRLFNRNRQKKEKKYYCTKCGYQCDEPAEKKTPFTIDSVQFSAISSNVFCPGKYSSVNIVMYEDEFRQAVDDIKKNYGNNVVEKVSGFQNVNRESSVKVVLTSNDFDIEDNVREHKWCGKYLNFEFAVKVPIEYEDSQILLSASVYINDIPATKLQLILDNVNSNVEVIRNDITSAFVSYSSEDRGRVAAIVQGMKMSRPDLDLFFDIISLRTRDYWNDKIQEAIDNRDILFLCWSKNAKDSKWVDKEWRYAYESKGIDSIEPVTIDPPEVCPPPIELNKKHFNDLMVYIINATEKLDKEKEKEE